MEKQQLFIPCYFKLDKWYYSQRDMPLKEAEEWINKQCKTCPSQVLPYSCTVCFSIIRDYYVTRNLLNLPNCDNKQ